MDPSVIQTVHHTIDWTILATAIGSVVAILGINVSIFAWLRSDIKELKSEMSADRRDILKLIIEIKDEMKDFHGRLCSIEEKRKEGR